MKALFNLIFILLIIAVGVGIYFRDDIRNTVSHGYKYLSARMSKTETPSEDPWKTLVKTTYFYLGEEQYFQAMETARRAIHEAEKEFGGDHPNVAICLRAMAYCHTSQGQFSDARALHEKAVAILENAYGSNSIELANGLTNLADIYMRQQDPEEAWTVYNRALSIHVNNGSNTSDTAHILTSLGHIHLMKADYDSAESCLNRALNISEQLLEANDSELTTILLSKGHTLLARDNSLNAESLFNRAVNMRVEVFGSDDPLVAEGLISLSMAHRARQKLDKASEALERAIAIREEQPDCENYKLTELRKRLTRIQEMLE